MSTDKHETVESFGDPLPESKPVGLPCKGPACGEEVRTYLTEADAAARPTVRVLRYTPETDDERLVRYWFCSAECRAAFVAAVEDGDRDETLYDETDAETAREAGDGCMNGDVCERYDTATIQPDADDSELIIVAGRTDHPDAIHVPLPEPLTHDEGREYVQKELIPKIYRGIQDRGYSLGELFPEDGI